MMLDAKAVLRAPPLLRHVVPFTTGIAALQCPSTVAVRVTRYLAPLMSVRLNVVKAILPE